MEIILIIITFAFFATLIRIELNTKKKLENDEKIMAQLDELITTLKFPVQKVRFSAPRSLDEASE